MEERVELKKGLKQSNVWALALGTIIGFGCFVLPGDWIQEAGPIGTSLGLFLGGLMMLVIGKSYGFMVRNFPVAGGEYAYSYQKFGRNHAFACGWLLTLGYLLVVPLNATALPILVKFTAPNLFTKGYMYTVAGWDVYIFEIIIASGSILIFGFLNYRGVQVMGSIQLLMVILLVGSVMLLGGGSFLRSGVEISNLQPLFAPDKTALASILAILAISPWAYAGFDTIPQASEEFGFSPRKALKLIFLAVLIGALMYAIVTLGTAIVFPWQQLVSQKPVWATGTSMKASMGYLGLFFLITGVTMGIFTGINGFYLATSRLLFSMGRSKVLPRWFARIHPKYKTPYNAIFFTMIISVFAPWFGRQVILWILDMSAVGTAVGYCYTCLAAYFLSKALSKGSRNVSHLAGFLFAAGFIVLLCVPGMPAFMGPQSWIAFAAWVVMGVSFYMLQAKQYRRLHKDELDYLILGKKPGNETGEERPLDNS
jgi:amino acid transporter